MKQIFIPTEAVVMFQTHIKDMIEVCIRDPYPPCTIRARTKTNFRDLKLEFLGHYAKVYLDNVSILTNVY